MVTSGPVDSESGRRLLELQIREAKKRPGWMQQMEKPDDADPLVMTIKDPNAGTAVAWSGTSSDPTPGRTLAAMLEEAEQCVAYLMERRQALSRTQPLVKSVLGRMLIALDGLRRHEPGDDRIRAAIVLGECMAETRRLQDVDNKRGGALTERLIVETAREIIRERNKPRLASDVPRKHRSLAGAVHERLKPEGRGYSLPNVKRVLDRHGLK